MTQRHIDIGESIFDKDDPDISTPMGLIWALLVAYWGKNRNTRYPGCHSSRGGLNQAFYSRFPAARGYDVKVPCQALCSLDLCHTMPGKGGVIYLEGPGDSIGSAARDLLNDVDKKHK